jgi:hypothetical protein
MVAQRDSRSKKIPLKSILETYLRQVGNEFGVSVRFVVSHICIETRTVYQECLQINIFKCCWFKTINLILTPSVPLLYVVRGSRMYLLCPYTYDVCGRENLE